MTVFRLDVIKISDLQTRAVSSRQFQGADLVNVKLCVLHTGGDTGSPAHEVILIAPTARVEELGTVILCSVIEISLETPTAVPRLRRLMTVCLFLHNVSF